MFELIEFIQVGLEYKNLKKKSTENVNHLKNSKELQHWCEKLEELEKKLDKLDESLTCEDGKLKIEMKALRCN